MSESFEKKEEKNEEEAKEETVEKKPEEFEELFLTGEDNRTFFEKLPEASRDFARGIYEDARINMFGVEPDIIKRAKMLFNDKLFGWHHGKAVELKFDLDQREKEIERLEDLKNHHGGRFEAIQKEMGTISPKILAKAEQEKENFQKLIDREKIKTDGIRSQLEYRNAKKGIYEGQRNKICGELIDKVKEHLNPYEEKLETLKDKNSRLSAEIKGFRDKNKGYSEEIKNLERKMKAAPYRAERKVYGAYIKKLEKALAVNEKLSVKSSKEELKIKHNIANTELKASPWRNKKSELERIVKRQVMETAIGVKKREKKQEISQGKEEISWPVQEDEIKPEKEGVSEEEKINEDAGEKSLENLLKEVGTALGEEKEEGATEEIKEKAAWGAISNREKKFWIDRFGKGGAKSLFQQYEGDFEDLAKHRQSQKKYIEEWKKIRKE